jgi:hypothetical protein
MFVCKIGNEVLDEIDPGNMIFVPPNESFTAKNVSNRNASVKLFVDIYQQD